MSRTFALLTLTLSLSFGAAACGGSDGPSCGKVVDHVGKLTGLDLSADQRKGAIAKCEKEPAAKRACVLKADSVEAMMGCK